ncbi:MAG: S-layer homology domain-containing protein [Clostridia bacterium]|nr:S-layer homology domain-containing protein [Clostridia bacterium]
MNKSYKRLIAVLISAFVLCGFCVLSASAENVAEPESVTGIQAVQQENIPSEIQKMMTVLKSFNIVPDYYDYNLPLAYEVPRADFAASVARMMGKSSYSGQEVYFYDVPRNYWAFNEISNLTQMGIINGAGDKIFNPGDPITKSAAYKIILCAMGYRDYAEVFGGYPNGYSIVASRIKLSDGVKNGEIVTMEDMLHILYNALTVKIMEPVASSGGNITYEVSDSETLISSYRDIYFGTGDVTGANTVTIYGGRIDKDITLIDGEKYDCEGFNMIDYLGERIEFFYKIEDLSDAKKLLWVGSKEAAQDVKTISVDKDANLDTDSFTYTYYDENGKKRRINLDRGMLLVYNGGIIDSGFDKILNNNRYECKLISNGDKYSVVVVREYKNYIVGNINSADCVIYDKNDPHDSVDLNENNYDTFSIKLMGNDDMTFESIKTNDVLTVYKSKDNAHVEVFVSNNTANGTVEEIDTRDNIKIKINGSEYRVDEKLTLDKYDVGDSVTAYLNLYGEIVYIAVSNSEYQGSFLIKAGLENDFDDTLYIRQLGEDSKVTSLKCAEKLIIDGTMYKNAKDAYRVLLAGENSITPQFALIKKNGNGEIKEIDTTYYDPAKETLNSLQVDVPFWDDNIEKTYKARLLRASANAARIGEKIVFDANTKVFVVPYVSDYDNASEDDFWVTIGSKLANDTQTYAQSYKTAENIGITKYMLLTNYDPSRVNAETPMLVKGISYGMDGDGNTVEVLDGYQGVALVHIKADESVGNLFSGNGVLPGDIVTIKKDSYGKVKECTVAYDYRTDEHKAITALNDITGMFVGYANSVVDNVVKIGYASGADVDFAINAMSKPVLLYDKSDKNNPISTATTGDIVTYLNDPGNCSTVFIVTNRMQPQMFVIYK